MFTNALLIANVITAVAATTPGADLERSEAPKSTPGNKTYKSSRFDHVTPSSPRHRVTQ